MNLSPRAMQLLALQQEKYLRSLPEKKVRLTNAWNAIKQQGWLPECAEALKTEVHRLSGSAGSYGLDSLGKAAQQLDAMLADNSNPKATSAEMDAKAGGLMEVLFHALDKDIKDYSDRSNPST